MGQCFLFPFVDANMTSSPKGCRGGYPRWSSGYRAANVLGGSARLLYTYNETAPAVPVTAFAADGQTGPSMLLLLNARLSSGTLANLNPGFTGNVTAVAVPPPSPEPSAPPSARPSPEPSVGPSAADQGGPADSGQPAMTAGFAVLGVALSAALIAGAVLYQRRARATRAPASQRAPRAVVSVGNPVPKAAFSVRSAAPAEPPVQAAWTAQQRFSGAPLAPPPGLFARACEDPGPVEDVSTTTAAAAETRPAAAPPLPPARPPPPPSSETPCPMCMKAQSDVALSPCGHRVCSRCGSAETTERCPVCGTSLQGDAKVRLYV